MSDFFSEEMKREINKLFDIQYMKKEIDKRFLEHKEIIEGQDKAIVNLNLKIVDCIEELSDFERRLDEVPDIEPIRDRFEQNESEIEDIKENAVQKNELETLVGETMLKLMPNFNLKISKIIRSHLVSIAEFVIKNFKEKE